MDPGSDLPGFCARGRATWARLELSDETFARHLAAVMARAEAGAPPLRERAIEDLYLACACLHGVSGAVEAFDATCDPAIRAAVARIARSAPQSDEIVQQLREVVLVGRAEAPPRIGSYAGRGPLSRWVAVTAQNIGLMILRSDRAEGRVRDAAAAEAMLSPADPEVAFIRERYRGALETALADALSALANRERLLLRLNLVNGVSIEKIARMYGVNHSTASRWLGRAREIVRDEMQRLLRERIRVTPSQIGSLWAVVGSQMELSLSRLLSTR
jgi:RNA polymerase sigma-70 factor, ECF subfamily